MMTDSPASCATEGWLARPETNILRRVVPGTGAWDWWNDVLWSRIGAEDATAEADLGRLSRPFDLLLTVHQRRLGSADSRFGYRLLDERDNGYQVLIVPSRSRILLQRVQNGVPVDGPDADVHQNPENIILAEGTFAKQTPYTLRLSAGSAGVRLNLGFLGQPPDSIQADAPGCPPELSRLVFFSEDMEAGWQNGWIRPRTRELPPLYHRRPVGSDMPAWADFVGTHYAIRRFTKVYRGAYKNFVVRLEGPDASKRRGVRDADLTARRQIEAYEDDAHLPEGVVSRTGPFSGRTVYINQATVEEMLDWADRENTFMIQNRAQRKDRMQEPHEVLLSKDEIYWAVRLIYESRAPETVPIIWEIGNEINAHRVSWVGQPDLARRYVEHSFAPTVDAIRRASRDIYGSDDRIPIMQGSIANGSAADAQAWLHMVLDTQIRGDIAAADLAGKRVIDLIDYLAVHYIAKGPFWRRYLDYLYERYIATGKVRGLWSTEEMGGGGGRFSGPYAVGVPFRFMDWWSRHDWKPRASGIAFWGDWWGLDTYPTAYIVEELMFDFLGSRPLANLTDASAVEGDRDAEVYVFADRESEQGHIAAAVLSERYELHPHQDPPEGTVHVENLTVPLPDGCAQGKARIAVKKISPRTVETVAMDEAVLRDGTLVVRVAHDIDLSKREVLLVFATAEQGGCGKVFEREFVQREQNRQISGGEIVSFHYGNCADTPLGGLDSGMAGDGHGIVASSWNGMRVSYEVTLQGDYPAGTRLQITLSVLTGTADLYWDGELLVSDASPDHQETVLTVGRKPVFSPGPHLLEVRNARGYAFVLDALRLQSVPESK